MSNNGNGNKPPKPAALTEEHKSSFELLRSARVDSRLLLLSAVKKADNSQVALVCAAFASDIPGETLVVPLAELLPGVYAKDAYYSPNKS